MCGRFASFSEADDLAEAYGVDLVDEVAASLPASWNVAPTQPLRIVLERPERLADGGVREVTRQLRVARWGLVPSWAKDRGVGARMVNARRESVAGKPAFRPALAARRGVVPADGYYEWQPPPGGDKGPKRPHYIHADDGAPLALAALYEFWRDPALAADDPARWLLSATIVTAQAGPGLDLIHPRRPVVLSPGAVDGWLDPTTTVPAALGLLDGPAPPLAVEPVSRQVGDVRADEPGLIEPTGAGWAA